MVVCTPFAYPFKANEAAATWKNMVRSRCLLQAQFPLDVQAPRGY